MNSYPTDGDIEYDCDANGKSMCSECIWYVTVCTRCYHSNYLFYWLFTGISSVVFFTRITIAVSSNVYNYLIFLSCNLLKNYISFKNNGFITSKYRQQASLPQSAFLKYKVIPVPLPPVIFPPPLQPVPPVIKRAASHTLMLFAHCLLTFLDRCYILTMSERLTLFSGRWCTFRCRSWEPDELRAS